MRQATLQQFAQLIQRSGPVGTIVKGVLDQSKGDINDARRVGSAVAALQAAGYTAKVEQAEHGVWFRAFKDGALKLQGYSPLGQADAALHAIFGAIREENAALVVAEELSTMSAHLRDVTAETRQKLESTYIREGLSRLRTALGK